MFPSRSKVSDGSIGDVRHQKAGTSDHLPNSNGVVTAIDITHSHTEGIDCRQLAKMLQSSKDPRIKYLIWDKQITQKTDASKWKPYHGANSHQHHLHISVASNPALYDSGTGWNLVADTECYYTVQAGDTLGAIIKRFNLSMLEFYQLNGFNGDNFDADNIHIGEKFKIRLR